MPAYYYISYGFILGELVRRVREAAVPDVLAAEFLGPLGLRDIHLGLPGDLWSRHVPVRGRAWPAGSEGARHQGQMSDAVIAACS